VRDDQLTPPAGYLSPAPASDQVDRALTFLEPARWRLIARVVDLSALTLGAVVALLLSGSLVTHLDFAAVYAAFVLSTTRGPQMLVQRMLPCGYDFFADAARACTVSVLLALGTGALLSFSAPESLAIELWLLTVLAMGATRVAAALLGQRARREGALMTPALVVGAGFVGARVFRRLVETPEYGLRPVGFLDADPLPGALEMDDGAPVLGGPDDLAEVVAQTGARHVILAFASERDNRLVELVKRCRKLRIDVSVVPRLYESMNERATLEHIGGLPLLSLKAVDPKGWQFALKHTFDRVAAMLALLALAPLMVVLALAVKLSTPGPVIFRQRRVGRDGRVFDVFKFRTMRQEGRSSKFKLEKGLAPGGIEGVDRRTPIGRWLRATSLDELPQLINVLRGEMSLVGPRPERPEFVEQFAREVHGYTHRHRVKSGITGWAQVNGLRGQTSIEDRAEWDNHYIENWSLGLELRTLALTLAEVLRFRDGGPSTVANGSATNSEAEAGLGLVPVGSEESADPVWFCGYCGAPPIYTGAPAPVARVCGHCGQGLMLESHAEAAPRHGEGFLVVDSRLAIQAVSKQAEELLGIPEQEATDRQLGDLLIGADAELALQEGLRAILESASTGHDPPGSTFVRPRATYGVRMRARISACGPPRGALIVLEAAGAVSPNQRHLRLVEEQSRAAESA